MSSTEENKKRIFNSKIRKRLSQKIKNISDKEEYIKIFKIMNRDLGDNFSENKNGIWFNLNLLSDNAIKEIVDLMDTNLDTTITESDSKFKYVPYDIDDLGNLDGPRLSNHEKSLIRKMRHSDVKKR